MHNRLEGVSIFVEAVEARSFSRAGERLALSRSAVGKSIARLEARLGVRLFHRTTRTQALTEEGQAYYEHCQRALDELRAGESFLESGRTEISGIVRISMPVMFGRHCVAPILVRLAKDHPKLEFDFRFSDLVVDLIGEGYDLVIRNGLTAEGAGLRTRKLLSQQKIVCASPAYLEEHGRPEAIADLMSHEALVYRRNNRPFPIQLLAKDGKVRECDVKGRLRFDNMEAILDAAVAGIGIAWLPDWLIHDHLRDGRLVPLIEDFPSVSLDTFAVWPDTQHLPMRTRLVIDTLAAELPKATRY